MFTDFFLMAYLTTSKRFALLCSYLLSLFRFFSSTGLNTLKEMYWSHLQNHSNKFYLFIFALKSKQIYAKINGWHVIRNRKTESCKHWLNFIFYFIKSDSNPAAMSNDIGIVLLFRFYSIGIFNNDSTDKWNVFDYVVGG